MLCSSVCSTSVRPGCNNATIQEVENMMSDMDCIPAVRTDRLAITDCSPDSRNLETSNYLHPALPMERSEVQAQYRNPFQVTTLVSQRLL